MHPCTVITRCRSTLRSTPLNKLLCASLLIVSVLMLVKTNTGPRINVSKESLKINSAFLARSYRQTNNESARHSTRQSPSPKIWKIQTKFLHPDVKIVPSTLPESFLLPYHDCVPLPESPKAGVVVCLHPVKDDYWISGALKAGNMWESENVVQFKEYLQRFPDMIFVDLGSNIGDFTLYAAAMGHKTLAVEMLPINVQHMQMALGISGLGSEVIIVNNALYSDHRILTAKFYKENIGGTSLVNKTKEIGAADNNSTVYVQTICMDDLIPLLEGDLAFVKMDIENSEHYALRGARMFFQKVNIQVVQMEWLDRGKEESAEILQFMESLGYVVSKTLNHYTPHDSLNKTKDDVYFLKKEIFRKN